MRCSQFKTEEKRKEKKSDGYQNFFRIEMNVASRFANVARKIELGKARSTRRKASDVQTNTSY